ncbi:MAG TPA: AAA family ATPase [Candidatus Tumulicola sp.]|nr:AAA family ATPase [Candidatus Tumulicola sp.]
MRRYLLLGTDTDVGKTTVAAALCAAALRSGLLVAACKPVETGAPERGDLDVIRAIAGNAVRCVAGARLELAAAPSAAARAAGAAAPSIAACAACVRSAEAGVDAVVVETCGGALTPLSDTEYVADLATALPHYRVLLVAALKLGVLSHSFGVAEYLNAIGRPMDGVVLCERFGPCDAWYLESTEADLAARGLRVVARVAFGDQTNAQRLAASVQSLIDVVPEL